VKIPTILQSELALVLEALRKSAIYDPKISYLGFDDSVDSDLVENLVSELTILFSKESKKSTKSKDKRYSAFELAATPIVLDFFCRLPHSCKFNPGFFGYLSYRIRDVIVWRFPPNDSEGWSKNFVASASSSEFVDGFIPRLIIRGLIAKGSTEAEGLIQQDFWRSHVLRVKTGFSQEMSQAFAEEVVESSIAVEEQRSIAKRIRSIRSNVIFELLTKVDARKIVRDLRK
jgi:hypothetical protein